MWHAGDGMGWWMVWGGLMMFLFWGAIIALIVWVIQTVTRQGVHPDTCLTCRPLEPDRIGHHQGALRARGGQPRGVRADQERLGRGVRAVHSYPWHPGTGRR